MTQEDARATYAGTTFSSTSTTITVPLHATIQDISAISGSGDSQPGDLHHASVSFVDRDSRQTIAADLPITVGATNTTGTVDFQWPVTINATAPKKSDGSSGKSFTIGIVVNGWYTRNATADDTLVMVAEPPVHGAASGGGYLLVTAPGGTSAPDAGSRLNFSFNVLYGQGTRVSGGFINVIARSNGRVLQFRGVPSGLNGYRHQAAPPSPAAEHSPTSRIRQTPSPSVLPTCNSTSPISTTERARCASRSRSSVASCCRATGSAARHRRRRSMRAVCK